MWPTPTLRRGCPATPSEIADGADAACWDAMTS